MQIQECQSRDFVAFIYDDKQTWRYFPNKA